jgi:hypothetical protein
MQDQSSLGGRSVNRLPSYTNLQMARVTSTADFHQYGKLEAVFLDMSQPAPIWVFNDLDREPVAGDFILVGFMEGRKDLPYMHGFAKNQSYTTNFVVVKKDKVKLQLPIFEIGVIDGIAHEDVKTHLLDNDKQSERAYVEITEDHAILSYPTSEEGAQAQIELTADYAKISFPTNATGSTKATITITATGVDIVHPAGVLKSNGKRVALAGDPITGSSATGGAVTGTIT